MTTATGRLCLTVLAATLFAAVLSYGQETSDPNQAQFIPLKAPCRVFDTRGGNPGPLVTDTVVPNGSSATRYFKVRGSCGIPAEARASGSLAYNLTVVGTFNRQPFAGHMLVFPADLTQVPLASSINFPPSFTIANAAITRLNSCPSYEQNLDTACAPTRPEDIGIHLVLANGVDGTPSLGTAVHIVLDVQGYFRR